MGFRKHPRIRRYGRVSPFALRLLVLAMFLLGYRFAFGQPAVEDFAASVRACDSGDGAKCADAGFAYLRGKGVPRDAARSLLLFTKGCDLGNAMACSGAVGAYPFGSQERLKYEVRACDSGYARQCLSLASSYERKNDPRRARELRQEACDKDPRWACAEAGGEYTGQRLASVDMVLSEHLFQQGCDHNDPVSCVYLGDLYAKGDGTPLAPTKALDLYRKSCNLEDPDPAAGLSRGFGVGKACDHLAQMYVSGDIVAKDDSMAFRLYRRACEHLWSCAQAGNMADEGRGTKRDPALAQRLLTISCKSGVVSSCERAGLLVLELHPDEGDQAVQLYRQGCEQIDILGDGHACFQLGKVRLLGLNGKNDLPGAINAFSLACRYGVAAGCDEKRSACAQAGESNRDPVLTRLCTSK